MKVKDLLKQIEEYRKENPDLDNWDIALEQHPEFMECCNCNKKDQDYLEIEDCYWPGEKVIFIKSHRIGCVRFNKHKTLGIKIHY
jgi:hypothetical protein